MKKNIILACLIGLLVGACNNNKETDVEIIIPIDTNQAQQDFPFLEKFHFSKMIPLETGSHCRISDITRVFSVDSLFIIWDQKSSLLLVYNFDGLYMNHIGQKGGATNEYIKISDVNLNYETQSIYLLDNASHKILEYSYTGEYKNSISLPAWSNGFLLSGHNLWLESNGQNRQKKMLLCIDKTTDDIDKSFFSFPRDERIPIYTEKAFIQSKYNSLFASPYLNTIYKIKESDIHPYIKLAFNGNSSNNSDLMDPTFLQMIETGHYEGHIHDVFLVNSSLFLSYYKYTQEQTKEYSVCYNMNTTEVDIYDYSILHDSHIPISPGNKIKGTYDNGIIFSLDVSGLPDKLIERVRETDGLECCDNMSNPILILYDVD